MTTHVARLLLALALALAGGMAGAAWAGPVTGSPGPTPTPTPSETPTPGPTPTPTPSETPTPGPTPTPTPSAIPTASATPTPTASATPTPTPTPQPGDLSGQYPFVDSINFDKNETLMNVDTGSNRFCLAGQVEGTDATTTLNRLVTFNYESLGTIKKATEKKVDGEFVSVDLTLTIEDQNPDLKSCDEVAVGEGNCEFNQTITSACKLKGSLRKEGDQGRARLKCEVGENFSAFGLNDPANQDLLENVTDAFPKRKNIKVITKKGKVRFTHKGEPAPEGLDVELSCDLAAPTATPAPPPS